MAARHFGFAALLAASLPLTLHCGASNDDDAASNPDALTASGPEELTFDELVTLSKLDGKRVGSRYVLSGAPAGLEAKLNTIIDTPRLSNAAFAQGARRHLPNVPGLGPSVRTVEWNIERGEQLDGVLKVLRAADSADARKSLLDGPLRAGADKQQIATELDAIANADVIVLNEVDNGLARSGYKDVVAEIATALQMNYAWAAEFIEVDPMLLGTEKLEPAHFQAVDAATKKPVGADHEAFVPNAELAQLASEANAQMTADPTRQKSLHGVAILSRYRIKPESVKAHPLQTVCHDWNADEKKPLDIAGKGFNFLAEKIFLEKIAREIRHGGRTALTVDLEVPSLDGGTADTVTVVTAHIEDKGTPKCRAQQAKETLAQVADRRNPVVFAGDFNTFGTDGRPMTVERLLFARFKDPQWIAKQLISRLVPYAGWAFTVASAINWVRLSHDPTGINIPLFLPNPERGFFDAVEGFRFPDGARFDFRGDSSRTVNGTAKTLANSNERASKGFEPTSALARTFAGIGTFKIDWMFVRGYATDPRKGSGSYRMAPHFPRTMRALQFATDPRLSDHAPIVVNLPLKDPCVGASTVACAAVADIPDQSADFSDSQPATWTDENADPDQSPQTSP